MFGTFFYKERSLGGWRFWLLWAGMTSLAFSIGLALEYMFFQELNSAIAAPLAGIAQAWVVGRHVPVLLLYAIGTLVMWLLGLALADILLPIFASELTPTLNFIARLLIAGLLAGIPQWLILKSEIAGIGWWWMLVSAVGVFGIISGGVLSRHIDVFEFAVAHLEGSL